ncbi:hypothetical protein QFC21_002601 [Naganishia friedmannii]|uniref:Uncharacterized protein n=1 Tax=Naganishia friedmannii TaxID=89922 RepID=A0ACC2VUR7_9TREE|nr:hypothetical protein QFC21_002601 [Naganishia friedmannii]
MSSLSQKAKETAASVTPSSTLTPNFATKDSRIQIDPALTRHSLLSAGRKIVAAEGPRGLLTGFAPTSYGYLLQGGAKFAGYEFWKKRFVEVAGSQERAVQYRTWIYLGGASIAEFFADILLAPMEATRIRLVSNPQYASGMISGLAKIAKTEGVGSLYAGFLPLICKQIPYAIGQFTVNEFCHELAFKGMTPAEQEALSQAHKLTVTLGSGIIAGFAAAILSHPADTLLSQINKGHGPQGPMVKRLYTLGKQAGFSGLFAGLGPRMIMTAGLVTGQFVIYKYIKEALNAPPGVEIHKAVSA